MTKKEFKKLFNNRIVLLDGAVGTFLQNSGMPHGVCPEKWSSQNRNLLIDIQKRYIEAGSEIIYTATLGANPIQLSEYGLSRSLNLTKLLLKSPVRLLKKA